MRQNAALPTATLLLAIGGVITATPSHASGNGAPPVVCSGGTCSITFTDTGTSVQVWAPPAGLTSVAVRIGGGPGGPGSSGGAGGAGGRVTATIPADSQSPYSVLVGQPGGAGTASGGAGGWPNGGSGGGWGGGGGGGGSFVFASSGTLLAAAGGGGGGGACTSAATGGYGGDGTTAGHFGASTPVGGGGGGTATNNGAGAPSWNREPPGSAGSGTTSGPGNLANGGAGSASGCGGGGGGGGYYGGGGGAGYIASNSGGGGGGSGYAAPGLTGVGGGTHSGTDGQVVFSWTDPRSPQAVVFGDNTIPTAPVVGQTWTPTATGGGSGNPVTYRVDGSSANVCGFSGAQLTFVHTGGCTIYATQAGDGSYQDAPEISASTTVGAASTSTSVSVSAQGIGVTVTAVAPGGGTPTGYVNIVIDAGTPDENDYGNVTLDSGGSGLMANTFPPGPATVTATYLGSADYATSTNSVSFTPKVSTTTVSIGAESVVTATVTAANVADGTPAGTVQFSVDGSPVGDPVPLAAGAATAATTLPTDAAHTATATYAGNGWFAGSTDDYARTNPTIAASVTSAQPAQHGWYRVPARVTFTCTAGSGTLAAGACPAPVPFRTDGVHTARRQVTATDGGVGRITVRVRIDGTVPTDLAVHGVTDGATYSSLRHPTCTAADALSGLASCVVDQARSGSRVTYTATATDRAGNARQQTGHYTIRR